MCMQLVQKPELYDVLVLPNLYGDIVSATCAPAWSAASASRPGANIGVEASVFEPVHGSAPKYAGLEQGEPHRAHPVGRADAPPPGRAGRGRAGRGRPARGDRRGQVDDLRPRRPGRHQPVRRRHHRAGCALQPDRAHTEDPCSCATGAARGCSRGRSTASRDRHLGVHPAPRARHLARGRATRSCTTRCWRSTPAPGRVLEVAARRGAAVPRAQRPADHHHGLLAVDDPLPPPAVVRELGRVRGVGVPVLVQIMAPAFGLEPPFGIHA